MERKIHMGRWSKKKQYQMMRKAERKRKEIEDDLRWYGERLRDLFPVEENVRNNNVIMEEFKSSLDMLQVQIGTLKKAINKIKKQENEKIKKETLPSKIKDDSPYENIDYYKFENYFRGSNEHVKKVQGVYFPYYKDCKNVIDLGCGRGEFLELLKENGVNAVGIDLYDEFIELCTEKGLTVVQEDALSYLEECEKTDGIFAAQLVEHLSIGEVVELCNLAYEKLEAGRYMILETPNPMSLAIFTHAFYIDPSHEKPVHPLTLKYIAEEAGFRSVEILYTEDSKLPVTIPEIKGQGIQNLERFNESMQIVSDTLFGSQDYALIARK